MPRPRLLEPWRTRLLWASVALNLFAGVALAVPLVWRPGPHGSPGFDMIVDRMARGLPSEDARAFRAAMEKDRPGYDQSRGQLTAARTRAAEIMQRQPFDPAAARAALAAMRDELRDTMGQFDESLVAAMEEVSPAGRTKLVDTFQRGRR